MLSKYQQKRQEGFTIIEVLIVLAIAGLILLVVFLAVPALQRNSRNTQRDNDVAGILGGMSEYVNNNNGALPTAVGEIDDTTLRIGAASGVNDVEVNLGYYDAGAVTIETGDQTNNTTAESVVLVTSAECTTGFDAEGDGAPSRGYVALYTKEDDAKQCRES